MAGFIEIDASELRKLEVDLSGAPARVQWGASRTLLKSARLVDREMVIDASGHRHLATLQTHVSHEMIAPFTAEIGIETGGQGSLAHIIAYGSVNNGPVYDHTAGLRRAEPAVLEMFAETAEESVLGGDGAE